MKAVQQKLLTEKEVDSALAPVLRSNAGTGFMHESFNKDDAKKFTRKWFAWANTIFGELVMELHHKKLSLLNSITT